MGHGWRACGFYTVWCCCIQFAAPWLNVESRNVSVLWNVMVSIYMGSVIWYLSHASVLFHESSIHAAENNSLKITSMMNFSFKIVSRKSMENIYLAILLLKFHRHTELHSITTQAHSRSSASRRQQRPQGHQSLGVVKGHQIWPRYSEGRALIMS